MMNMKSKYNDAFDDINPKKLVPQTTLPKMKRKKLNKKKYRQRSVNIEEGYHDAIQLMVEKYNYENFTEVLNEILKIYLVSTDEIEGDFGD